MKQKPEETVTISNIGSAKQFVIRSPRGTLLHHLSAVVGFVYHEGKVFLEAG